MALSNINFLVRFLPVFLLVYYVSTPKMQRLVLFAGSILFYGLGNWIQCLLLLGLTCVNYLMLIVMQKHKRKAKRKFWMILLVALNAAILILYKYFTDTLPMGISFYTFMNISCFVDIYNKEAKPVSPISYANYVLMFPKILQGPIVRYQDFRVQLLRKHPFYIKNIEHGLELFIVGMGFKILIADQMFTLWNSVNMVGYSNISPALAWLGAAAFAMELYFDFQGYSLMARGVARMIGYDLPDNFHHPYGSKTIAEFYRRWHATLGNWFKNYIYFPLGGSREGNLKTVRNLLVVWLFTGIWHGTSANFVIWAMVLVAFIIMEKFVYGKYLDKYPILGTIYIWTIIPVTWVIFAIPDFEQMKIYLARMFPFFGIGQTVNASDYIIWGKPYLGLMITAFIVSLPIAEEIAQKMRKNLIGKLVLFAVFWFCVYEISISTSNPFMYGGF